MGKQLGSMQRSRKQQQAKQGAERFHPTVAGFKGGGGGGGSTQVMPTMKAGGGRSGGKGMSENSPNIEGEYISNLQKQVYFLELESKLLREKVNEKPPDGLDVPGPLDDHLLKLKQKYATLEA